MKVTIIGDGVSGRLLYYLLQRKGIQSQVYGIEHKNRCGHRGCAWGISLDGLSYINKLGIGTASCMIRGDSCVAFNGRKVNGELVTIDKPHLLSLMTERINYGTPDMDADIIVDATGISRTVNPTIKNEKVAINFQYRVRLNAPLWHPEVTNISGGYIWEFPLAGYEAHIGGGSTTLSADTIKQAVWEQVKSRNPQHVICGCSEPIRLSGLIMPVVAGKTAFVGEAAGMVVPFGGGGIHLAAQAAYLLAKNIAAGDLQGYNRDVGRYFRWISRTRKIVDDMEKGKISLLSMTDALTALRYQGMKPTIGDMLYIRKKLIEANQ